MYKNRNVILVLSSWAPIQSKEPSDGLYDGVGLLQVKHEPTAPILSLMSRYSYS
jgi:hypothetical protein